MGVGVGVGAGGAGGEVGSAANTSRDLRGVQTYLQVVLALRQRGDVAHELETVLRVTLKVSVRHAGSHGGGLSRKGDMRASTPTSLLVVGLAS